MTHVSTVRTAVNLRPHFGRCICMDTSGYVTTACRTMTQTETEFHPRPMVHLPNGMYAEWCECGSPPSSDFTDDILVKLGKSHGSRTGVLMLYHYDCLKKKARGD